MEYFFSSFRQKQDQLIEMNHSNVQNYRMERANALMSFFSPEVDQLRKTLLDVYKGRVSEWRHFPVNSYVVVCL